MKQQWWNIEWFSVECRKTKTRVITLANHKEHTQYSESIKTRSNYRYLKQSAGKRVRVSHDWFWFYFWLDEKLARVFLNQSCSVENAKPITFDTQMKTALMINSVISIKISLTYFVCRVDNSKEFLLSNEFSEANLNATKEF